MLRLIETPHYSGYLIDDIAALLQENFLAFQLWIAWQTCAIHEGQVLVYRWDWERWLERRPDHPLTWD